MHSIQKELPPYAQPLFVRMQKVMEITTTFKHIKGTLQKEGYNPNTISVRTL